jgi:hypothetical protein
MAAVHGFDVAAQPGDVRQSISLSGRFTAVDRTGATPRWPQFLSCGEHGRDPLDPALRRSPRLRHKIFPR